MRALPPPRSIQDRSARASLFTSRKETVGMNLARQRINGRKAKAIGAAATQQDSALLIRRAAMGQPQLAHSLLHANPTPPAAQGPPGPVTLAGREFPRWPSGRFPRPRNNQPVRDFSLPSFLNNSGEAPTWAFPFGGVMRVSVTSRD